MHIFCNISKLPPEKHKNIKFAVLIGEKGITLFVFVFLLLLSEGEIFFIYIATCIYSLVNTYLCAVLFLTVLWDFFDFPDAFHCIVSLIGYF